MPRIAIHGFGRIGRSLMRVALENELFVPVSISDIKDISTLAALFEVDTNYGRWREEVRTTGGRFVVGGREIPYVDAARALPDWRALGVDLVIDCTGRATTRPARRRISTAAPSACWSARRARRAKTAMPCCCRASTSTTSIPGKHKIVSMASCTTNALAPVVKVVLENFGIKYGLFSTVHAYTNTQSLTDQPMKDRARLVGRGREHHPVVVGRGARARVHLAGAQDHRQGLPRPGAHRQHRRAEPGDRAARRRSKLSTMRSARPRRRRR